MADVGAKAAESEEANGVCACDPQVHILIRYYTILYYTILYYTILYYTILY